ncbi:MAG: OsmC family protein [Bdellovibrionota bacterium]
MHQMTIQYRGGFRTEAVHLDSQNKIISDAPKDNQGQGQAFSPTDLMSTSLAQCMLTIMAMKAKGLGWEFPDVSVELEKKMQANPRKVAEIVLRFDWKGLDQRLSSEQMATLKDAGMNCPVALSLDPSVVKTLHW